MGATRRLSIRVFTDTLERLDEESRREGLPRSRFAVTLLEERLRMQAHPGVMFRPGPTGRRAGLTNGPDIWEIMSPFRGLDANDPQVIAQVCETTGLHPRQIATAMRYYAEYPEEIDDRIQKNDEAAAQGHAEWLRQQAPQRETS